MDLQTAYEKAHTLEMAQEHSASFNQPGSTVMNAAVTTHTGPPQVPLNAALPVSESGEAGPPLLAAAAGGQENLKCFFCGFERHPRHKCPAKNATCGNCGRKGHFAKVC